MALQPGGQSPYAPATAVTTIIDAFRNRGLGTPINLDTLIRVGVTETVAPRTLAALKLLDLVTDDGTPSKQMMLLKEARGDDEFKARLQEWLQGVYGDVLQYADPSHDDATRIAEAFRGYEPNGQRPRMATLLIGLWEYAALPLPEGEKRAPRKPQARKPQLSKPAPRTPQNAARAGSTRRGLQAGEGSIHPGLLGLLQQVPPEGGAWTKQTRDNFLAAFTAVLDFSVQIREASYILSDDAEVDTS